MLFRSGGTHDRIGATLSSERVGRWRNEMSAGEQDRFERIAGDQLEAFGYGIRSESSGLTGAFSGRVTSVERVRSSLNSNNIKRQLKRLLPYYCWWRARKG